MRFVDEFRDPSAAKRLVDRIRARATRTHRIMEVCGGQTHSLLRHGIDEELRDCVQLIHGPGCPVCVTPSRAIDEAIAWAFRPRVTLTSFADMLRVPGTRGSLMTARAQGAHVRPVYSPLDAVQLARSSPQENVIFFAVGFETTAPATALAVLQAESLGLRNFFLLDAHVRVQPAMEKLAEDPQRCVEGFLAAGHVCTVMGYGSYESFVRRHQCPVVVTGFEPTDLLEGILDGVDQLERGEFRVSNRYGRAVRYDGNPAARELMRRVYEPYDMEWRGLGIIPEGGLRLRAEWRHLDARRHASAWGLETTAISDSNLPVVDAEGAAMDECLAGDVLAGRIKPTACPHFGGRCVPESPLGAPMVSAEGACAAYYRYAKRPVE